MDQLSLINLKCLVTLQDWIRHILQAHELLLGIEISISESTSIPFIFFLTLIHFSKTERQRANRGGQREREIETKAGSSL